MCSHFIASLGFGASLGTDQAVLGACPAAKAARFFERGGRSGQVGGEQRELAVEQDALEGKGTRKTRAGQLAAKRGRGAGRSLVGGACESKHGKAATLGRAREQRVGVSGPRGVGAETNVHHRLRVGCKRGEIPRAWLGLGGVAQRRGFGRVLRVQVAFGSALECAQAGLQLGGVAGRVDHVGNRVAPERAELGELEGAAADSQQRDADDRDTPARARLSCLGVFDRGRPWHLADEACGRAAEEGGVVVRRCQ